MKRSLLLFYILLSFSAFCSAQSHNEIRFPLQSSTSYIGNTVSNLHGGLRRGSAYLGLMNWKLETAVNTPAIAGSGLLHLNVANSHGGEPSALFVGDFQGVSNIEAGTHTFLYELWYRHTFSEFAFTVGLQDMNTEFANSACASLFQNSSFGIHATIAAETASPIYPHTALGVVGIWDMQEAGKLKLGVFDGYTDDFASNENNVSWCLCKKCGYFSVAEFEHTGNFLPHLAGTIKIGGYYSNSLNYARSIGTDRETNFGAYLVFEQALFSAGENDRTLSVFSQVSLAPQHDVNNNIYYSIGLHKLGLFEARPQDITGLAVATAHVHSVHAANETVIELSHQAAIDEHFFIKPNAQYIIHPAGTELPLHDAVIASVQFGFNF